jgi:hypothetical protein
MIYMLFMSRMRMVQVDVWGRLRVFTLRLDESRLQVDNVLAQRVIFRLNRLIIIFQRMQFTDLLLELLDVSLLALSKGSLCNRCLRKLHIAGLDDMRIDKAMRPSQLFNEHELFQLRKSIA